MSADKDRERALALVARMMGVSVERVRRECAEKRGHASEKRVDAIVEALQEARRETAEACAGALCKVNGCTDDEARDTIANARVQPRLYPQTAAILRAGGAL